MAADPDDAALAWAGDETPAAPAGRGAAQPNSGGRVAAQPRIETPQTGTPIPAPLLITYGVIAGIYLIYTIGWVLTVSQGAPARASVFDDIMLRVQQGLAVASPAIWFGAVFLLTRGRKPLVRLVWLLVGLAIVIPWPTVLGV